MYAFVQTHGFEVLVSWFIFNAIVSTMPEPQPGSFGYLWLYRALNTLAGNLKELVNFNVIPGTSVVHEVSMRTEKVSESAVPQQQQPTKIGS